jgi:plasmid maintenance system antidote protein VapI
VTAGNAPNIKAQMPETQQVTAPVDAKAFDTEEELLADMQERIDASQEEEYDEIVIPSSDELQRMTKAKIVEVADVLNEKFNAGFNVTTEDTKAKMILDFQEQTDALIAKLQDTGEFVSADDEGENDSTDVRDGGYF